MIVVGFCSSYREGWLVRNALGSLLDVGLDRCYLWEGPAGDELADDAPESDMGAYARHPKLLRHDGRWRTDGRKRNDWLQRVRRDFPDGPVWAVVVDADEILVNGRYLRDRLEWIMAEDAHRGASIATPDNPPMARWPLHIVEHEGSMSVVTARVFRVDLVRTIDHSSSVITNASGVQEGWGNFAATSQAWIQRWLDAIDHGAMIAWPPLPCEPYLVHRTHLRHPARRGLRMSVQEQRELAEAERIAKAVVRSASGPLSETFER